MAQTKATAPGTRLDPELAGRLWTQMYLIRRFEEKAAEMYALGKIGGFLHLYIGQEAVAVGATSALRPDDYVVSSYREHGHCLAKGSDPRRAMAELFGRRDGLCKGKGGSMHLFDRSVNFLGGHAIVGAHLPLAAGVAFAIAYEGGDQVILCFFGDGAVPEGEFHEAMNLAALWKLPVIFICENNRYAMGTAIHRALAQTEIWRFAEGYGMAGEAVDGMDVLAVRECVGRAVERARRDRQPTLVEARTYRFRGHSMRDPAGAVYRTKQEVERERSDRDPLDLFRKRCLVDGVLDEPAFQAAEASVERTVEEAVRFAEASPPPPDEWLLTDVYRD
jgi:pyruvate dehydrogenase E1 component alpha subunit